jgi:hypothetical protein
MPSRKSEIHEIKIPHGLFINGHSEKSGECDVNPFNGLSDISEWLAKPAYEIAPPWGFHSA